jgi:hypothetical protein
MKTGLLWFDDNPKIPLASKVERAARRYHERFGRAADVCYVHPKTLAGATVMPANVKIIASTTVQQNCFWVGIRPV